MHTVSGQVSFLYINKGQNAANSHRVACCLGWRCTRVHQGRLGAVRACYCKQGDACECKRSSNLTSGHKYYCIQHPLLCGDSLSHEFPSPHQHEKDSRDMTCTCMTCTCTCMLSPVRCRLADKVKTLASEGARGGDRTWASAPDAALSQACHCNGTIECPARDNMAQPHDCHCCRRCSHLGLCRAHACQHHKLCSNRMGLVSCRLSGIGGSCSCSHVGLRRGCQQQELGCLRCHLLTHSWRGCKQAQGLRCCHTHCS